MSWHPNCPPWELPYKGSSFSPSGCVEHRTIGRWTGDFAVLSRGRVPSVHFLIGQEWGQWVQFYEVTRTCAHAAGANGYAVGIEFSGQNGEPLTEWQLLAGASIHKWLIETIGIPQRFFPLDGGRIGYWNGYLSHLNVETTPNYRHYDYIEPEEFVQMAGQSPVVSPTPQPTPLLEAHEDNMRAVINKDTRDAVLVKDGFIERSLGKATAFGYTEPLGNTLALIYGQVELPQAQFELLALKPPTAPTATPTPAPAPVDVNALAEAVANKLAARLAA